MAIFIAIISVTFAEKQEKIRLGLVELSLILCPVLLT